MDYGMGFEGSKPTSAAVSGSHWMHHSGPSSLGLPVARVGASG